MKLHKSEVDQYVPDGAAVPDAWARTTHMGIGAHADDLEIMAIDGILECYEREDAWFAGVTASDGAGSPRAGAFKEYSDAEMVRTRIEEQNRAADIGQFGAMVQLGYTSSEIKDSGDARPIDDLAELLSAATPEIVYTHNLMDKHDAHVAVALRVIAAVRRLPDGERPTKLYGCEVWRDLDWLPDDRKVAFDCSRHEDLQRKLLEVFESQVAGGKRYDLAALGRRRANATYLNPHQVDDVTGAVFAVDLTPLILDDSLDPAKFATDLAEEFRADIASRFNRLLFL